METLGGGAEPETYASRLRGLRFWIPLTLFVVAVAGGFYVIGRSATSPVGTTADPASFDDPLLSRLIGTLEGNNLICSGLISDGPRHATCHFNDLVAPTDIRTFVTVAERLKWVRRQEGALNRIYLEDRTISYVITGKKWAITGTWAEGGRYSDTATPTAMVAQDVNRILDGCLELLPREAGSCAL